MESQRSFPGVLKGQGHEASCTVWFFGLVTLSGGGEFNYARMKITDVSPALPEGSYVLLVNGKEIAVRYHGGFWLAGSAL